MTRSINMILLALATAATACGGAGDEAADKSAGTPGKSGAPAPAPGLATGSASGSVGRDLTLAAGTVIRLRPDSAVTTRRHHVGAQFIARSVSAALSPAGDTVIPAGARFIGRVTASKPAESPRDSGTLAITFDRVSFGGHSRALAVRVASLTKQRTGRGVTIGDAGKVGAGTGVGAVAGRVIGGNARGTVIGGAVGAAAGAIYASETRDIDIVIPAGSPIRVELTQPFAREQRVATN